MQSSEVGDISGYYSCKGMEAGGKKYSGIAVIAKKSDVYVIQWMVGGGSTFSGVAIRQGDTFAASLGAARRARHHSRRQPLPHRKRAVSRRPLGQRPGPGVVQNETLTFLKKLDLED